MTTRTVHVRTRTRLHVHVPSKIFSKVLSKVRKYTYCTFVVVLSYEGTRRYEIKYTCTFESFNVVVALRTVRVQRTFKSTKVRCTFVRNK